MKNLNISCPLNKTGYGIASLNILRELDKLYRVSYNPISQPSVDNQFDYDMVSRMLNNRAQADFTAPYMKIWHQFDLQEHIGRGLYFAYPFFELDTFNDYEKSSMSVPDHFFVSSKWAKGVMQDNGISQNISVVPLGVDRNIFNDAIPKNRKDDKYVFLNIGKWEIRKGHDILLDLLDTAFPDNTNVELWILASENTNNYSNAEELSKWKTIYNNPKVKLFSGFDSQQQIAELIANADCGLYPSRAEGWNMELLETMSMNKPVITTNYSAHTEFCNKDNSYLIDILETEKAYDGKAFKGQGNWAKIDQKEFDTIIDYMRYLYNNNIRDNIDGVNTAKKYSWQNTANIIAKNIGAIKQ
jgi:glycosyltransferase involved in cell wall biosynthesis